MDAESPSLSHSIRQAFVLTIRTTQSQVPTLTSFSICLLLFPFLYLYHTH